MKEFQISAQYNGFYQDFIKNDFLSSKLFVFLYATAFAASLISIPYLSSHLNDKKPSDKPLLFELKNAELASIHSYFSSSSETIPKPASLETIHAPLASFALDNTQKLDLSFSDLSSKPSWFFHSTCTLEYTPLCHPYFISTRLAETKSFIPNAPKLIKMAQHTPPPQALPTIPALDHLAQTKINKIAPSKALNAPTKNSSKLAVADFKIKKSILNDTKKVGLSHALAQELTHAFSENLDVKKIRPGDRFTILYENHHGKNKQGQILAAKYTGQSKVIKVVRLSDGRYKGSFFAFDKLDKLYEATKSKSTISLLRKPVKNGRLTSPFQLNRFHPILKKHRPHLGVDYAAAPGTPIVASGDGKVTFMGYQKGYGNLIIIQHDKKYSTRYGHMSRFGAIKKGNQVKQGQVIGFVGKTGHATGHHLHYEIRVNGKPQNPLTVALPQKPKGTTSTLSKQHHKEIASKAKLLFAKMDELATAKTTQ